MFDLGQPVELPDLNGRSTTLIDRHGDHVAVLIHDPALDDEPELLEGVEAAAGIALENARLDAELRARLEELRGSPARIVERRRVSVNCSSAISTTARSSGSSRSPST